MSCCVKRFVNSMAAPVTQAHENSEDKTMIVRKLRLKKGWSQEQLASLTDLSVRTIQRIERGQTPSLESKRAFAAVFEIGIEAFEEPEATQTDNYEDRRMNSDQTVAQQANVNDIDTDKETVSADEKYALNYARSISEFYTHVLFFVIFMPIIMFTKGLNDPQTWLVCGGWTLGMVIHGLVAYEKITIFTAGWERRLAEKKLGRKL